MMLSDSGFCEFSVVVTFGNVTLEYVRTCRGGATCGVSVCGNPDIFSKCFIRLKELRDPSPIIKPVVPVKGSTGGSGLTSAPSPTSYYGSDCINCSQKGSSYCHSSCSLRHR